MYVGFVNMVALLKSREWCGLIIAPLSGRQTMGRSLGHDTATMLGMVSPSNWSYELIRADDSINPSGLYPYSGGHITITQRWR